MDFRSYIPILVNNDITQNPFEIQKNNISMKESNSDF